MPFFSRHLDLAALSDSLVGLSSTATTAHLASCERCRAEQHRLRVALDAVAVEAADDADAQFPPGVLERQRHSIRQRIERLGPGARLLTFPRPAAAQPAGASRADRRWITAAAVAGLLVGVAVGRIQTGGAPPTGTTVGAADGGQRSAAAFPSELWRDDPLLSDVDAVLTRETRPEFEALDGLTPTSDEGR